MQKVTINVDTWGVPAMPTRSQRFRGEIGLIVAGTCCTVHRDDGDTLIVKSVVDTVGMRPKGRASRNVTVLARVARRDCTV